MFTSTNFSISPIEKPFEATLSEKKHIGPCESTAYMIAKLTPKLIFSGAGWFIGFCLGGNLGAGIGDAAGAFIGSVISFLVIEMLIGRLTGLDPELEKMSFQALAIDRLKSALILSAGCFVGGLVFNTALTKIAFAVVGPSHTIFANLGKAFITGGITAGCYVGGTTTARGIYQLGVACGAFNASAAHELSLKNLKNDLITAFWIIFPAETAFVATSLPLLGTSWLMGNLGMIKSGAAVLIGGTAGALLQQSKDFAFQTTKYLTHHHKIEPLPKTEDLRAELQTATA